MAVPALLFLLCQYSDLGHLFLLFLQVLVKFSFIRLEGLVAQLACQPRDSTSVVLAPAVEQVVLPALLDDDRLPDLPSY